MKTGKALEHLLHDVDVSGCEVNVGGAVPNYSPVCSQPESEFLAGEVEYSQSRDCLRSARCWSTH